MPCIQNKVHVKCLSMYTHQDEDIKVRITKARQFFAILRPFRRMTSISTNTKLKIFNSNVKSVGLRIYGSETLRVIYLPLQKYKSSSTESLTDPSIKMV